MRKFYHLALTVIMLLGMSTNMSAYKLTVKWNNPGSLLIGSGSVKTPRLVELDADQTEYEFSFSEYTELCFYPADGYVLTSVSRAGYTDKKNNIGANEQYTQQSYYGVGASYNNEVITIETEKLVNDYSFSINVENGADIVNAYMSSSWSDGTGTKKTTYAFQKGLALKDGANTIDANAKYMTTLTISPVSSYTGKLYSVKRNGQTLTPVGVYYELKNITPEDKIEIRAYEDVAPVLVPAVLTISIPEALQGAIMNVRDMTQGTFPGVIGDTFTFPADGKFDVYEGDQIQVNINQGYELTKFMLGDKDITSSYDKEMSRIRFYMEGDETLTIEGTATVYGDVTFTAYVMNPDGVKIIKEQYDAIGNPPTDGTPITKNIEIPGYTITDKDSGSGESESTTGDNTIKVAGVTMTPENTQKYEITVSERRPMIWVSPMPGYYIHSVYDAALTTPVPFIQGNADPVNNVFYVVALPLDRDDKFNVEVTGNNRVTLNPSQAFTRNWDNRSLDFTLMEGEQSFSYNAEYDNPFTLIPPVPKPAAFNVTLNGRQNGITETDTGIYIINLTEAYVTDRYPTPTLKITAGNDPSTVDPSAVNEIGAEAAAPAGPIFNLQGICLGEDWESLPAGVYIRGGKKLIKK